MIVTEKPSKPGLEGVEKGNNNYPEGKGTDKDDSDKSKLVSWNEFTKETTIHGVKYIFDSADFAWRRGLWTIIVVTAVTIFTVQVGIRFYDYRKYETVTDVEQLYPRKVIFPAVTICNLNAYRISQVQNWKIYDFIDEFYQNPDEVNVTQYDLDDVNTEDFLLSTAHQMDDIIERCEWLGRNCDLSDFTRKLTSGGICYSFNADPQLEPYTISSAGDKGMLHLVLNAETYEHMRGPNSDAGIKILLHDQGEESFSHVKGLIFAPGKHYLVGVDQFQNEEKPDPYGDCNIESNETMAECTQKCQDNSKAEFCRCMAPHMASYENKTHEVCRLKDLLYCFDMDQPELKGRKQTLTSCSECTTPCYKTSYESKVSFAEISRFNVERAIISDNRRRDELTSKFLTANEVRQKAVKDIARNDEKVMDEFFTAVENAKSIINNALDALLLRNMFKVSGPLKELLYSDADTLEKNVALQFYHFMEIEVKLRDIDDDFQAIETMMDLDNDGNSGLQAKLKGCVELGINTTYILEEFNKNVNSSRQYGFDSIVTSQDNSSFTTIKSWIDENKEKKKSPDLLGKKGKEWQRSIDSIGANLSFCQSDLGTVAAGLKIAAQRIKQVTTILLALPDKYKSMIEREFYNTGASPDQFPEHIACISSLQTLTSTLEKALNGLPNDLYASSIDDIIDVTQAMVNISQATRHANFNDAKICNWVGRYNDLEFMVSYIDTSRNVEKTVIEVTSYSHQLTEPGLLLKSALDKELKIASDSATSYLQGDMSKLKVAQVFANESFNDMLDDLYSSMAEYKRKSSGMMSVYSKAWFLVKWVYEEAIGLYEDFKVPIMNETLVMSLNMTRKGDPALIEGFKKATTARRKMDFYYNITVQVFDEMMGKYLGNISEKVDIAITDLRKAIKNLQTPLHDYLEECKFGANALLDNFMQVDIFYQEIKYVKVTQRPAFGPLSLVGEIGGFLGLLLGASVMTVCEFLDYVSLKVYHKWMKNKVDDKK